MSNTRRDFLKTMGLGVLAAGCAQRAGAAETRPNIILCMTDDQGWGDTGYNGHPRLKTPHLDDMAKHGLRFERFYSAAPVCSPTRGSCLTGRHPQRYGILGANSGHLPPAEYNLAEVLKNAGYTTGHFGKWHLGTLTKTEQDSNRGGPKNVEHYAPPWDNGFDACFSTEAKVPTYDPMRTPPGGFQDRAGGEPYGTYYWTGPGEKATENLEGDDSRIIMDRALPFIEGAAKAGQPFFTAIWFHAPHLPIYAGPKHRAPYEDLPEEAQHYLGCITALDEQVGRLRATLRDLGAADNTMLWFCSDNGPEGKEDLETNGTAGPLRGRKRSLFEGGVRVPGLLEWPAKVPQPRTVTMPCCTSDYFPTVLDVLGIGPTLEPIDGMSLMPVVEGTMSKRPQPIAFQSKMQISLTDNRHKLISQDAGRHYMLFDIIDDPGETKDLAAAMPESVASMREMLDAWRESCRDSVRGRDYPEKRKAGT